MTLVPIFEPPPKRKRGRPRKVKPPKFDWATWTDDATSESPAAAPPPEPQPVETVAIALPPLSGITRFDGPRVRAGDRWKRRLRFPVGSTSRRQAQEG